MYNYVFHFNNYTNLWNAIPRELYNKYWDNKTVEGVLSSKRLEVLIELIHGIDRDSTFLSKIRTEDNV